MMSLDFKFYDRDPARPTFAPWLSLGLVVLALLYCAIALVIAGRDMAAGTHTFFAGAGMLAPLRLFLLGIMPAAAVYALLRTERKFVDPVHRRAIRTVAILAAGLAVISLAGLST